MVRFMLFGFLPFFGAPWGRVPPVPPGGLAPGQKVPSSGFNSITTTTPPQTSINWHKHTLITHVRDSIAIPASRCGGFMGRFSTMVHPENFQKYTFSDIFPKISGSHISKVSNMLWLNATVARWRRGSRLHLATVAFGHSIRGHQMLCEAIP